MIDFLSQLKQEINGNKGSNTQLGVSPPNSLHPPLPKDYPVLAEINIRSTDLHKIAQGDCCTLTDGALGIRFLLKDSFKVRNSNFVINNFVMQIVALGKDNVMHKEQIAVKTKVQTVTKTKEIKVKPKKESKEAEQAVLGKEEVY